MIEVIVLGGGTAGLISAITLLHMCEDVHVTVVRSSAIGHIMVGEGTFAATPRHLHDVLGIPRDRFYREVNPTWKLGIRFLWGPRPYFDYPFNERHDNEILPGDRKGWGYYSLDDHLSGPPLARKLKGVRLPASIGYHFENQPVVAFLERYFVDLGGKLMDATMTAAVLGERGIASIVLDTGETKSGDWFVDASGFRGELIHRQLEEPYVSMSDSLFCDRAVVGGWRRDEEPIKPYTTAETMDAGWAWQIEHEQLINRGYVYSSAHISADHAAAEHLRKNPKLREEQLRIVPFHARRIRRARVGNVVAIGNACGFLEPLEATNIQVICDHALRFARCLQDERKGIDTAGAFNSAIAAQWDNIRDFLAMHYRFNERLDTPFWKRAVNETPLKTLEPLVERYRRYGPALVKVGQGDMFGQDGHLALLLGMRVPWQACAIS